MPMKLYYLYHSGVAVETEDHLLIFDYYQDTLPGGVPALLQQVGKPVTVFASHSHYDHFNRAILTWKDAYPDITYVLSDDIPPVDGCHRIGPRKTLDLPGLTVSTLRSTDQGVAFVVTCDGHTIYHSGDLHWWHWSGEPDRDNQIMGTAYKREMERLAGVHLDVAFLPVDPRQEADGLRGIEYFAAHNDCPCLVPIHYSWDPSILETLQRTPGPWQGRLCILDDGPREV